MTSSSNGFSRRKSPFVTDNKRVKWANIPCAFDIETTSFYANGGSDPQDKRAVMYHWQFGIKDKVTYGRTWDELKIFLSFVRAVLDLNSERILVCYIHNLAYEFEWFREHFKWDKIFLLEERKPVYCRTGGIEFRCSLKLAGGASLATVGKNLMTHDVKKMEGDLDYEMLRSPLTPLTEKEKSYCENDIRVLLAYIDEKIAYDGDITRIPLTNTGYVRKHCREKCFDKFSRYREIMSDLTLKPDDFRQLQRAFMGGHTHANAHYVRKVLKNVASYDFTSSYPSVMLLEKFPMSRPHLVDGTLSDEKMQELLTTKCVMFDLVLENVKPRIDNEHPISKSKCWLCEGWVTESGKTITPLVDNGRIVEARRLGITVTEQDFITYTRYYRYSKFEIYNIRWFDRGYLPRKFVEAILDLYEKKTKLKDVDGSEIEYAISKNMINAAYGMTVTNPVRDEYIYIGGEGNPFDTVKPDLAQAMDRYNASKSRFLYYPWGVWVTAFSRRNLFTGIEAAGSDFVYSDTDSIKLLNYEAHRQYFDDYNQNIYQKIAKAAEFHGIDVDRFSPQNKKGSPKTIGIWDFEGVYDEFKTLGAKRYLVRVGDKYKLTLAGANKQRAMEYLDATGDPFGEFDDSLVIPPEYSGRLTLTYIDHPTNGVLVDYNGVPYQYHEKSSIHMEKSTYELTMSDDFLNFLMGVKQIEE